MGIYILHMNPQQTGERAVTELEEEGQVLQGLGCPLRDGSRVLAFTRGGGGVGEDVSYQFWGNFLKH